MSDVRIYTLTNPLTGQIFYVGATRQPLKARLTSSGYSGATFKGLKSQGIAPIIEEIEMCSFEDVKDRENYWMEQFRVWGFTLDNRLPSTYTRPNTDCLSFYPILYTRKQLKEAIDDIIDDITEDIIAEAAAYAYASIKEVRQAIRATRKPRSYHDELIVCGLRKAIYYKQQKAA